MATQTIYTLTTAQFDEAGEGMWLMNGEAYSSHELAKEAMQRSVDENLAYFGEGAECKYDGEDLATIYSGSITLSIRINPAEVDA